MNRKSWVNIRGLSILAVIMIHSTPGFLGSSNELINVLNLFLNQISRFAVPIFLISSGFGLTLKNEFELPLLEFYKKRLKVLPPYIFWTLFYFLLNRNYSIIVLVKNLITGSASGHLYFIVLLIIFYLLYPIFYRLTLNKTAFWAIVVVNVIGLTIHSITGLYRYPFFYNWMVYFCLGILLASKPKVLNWIMKRDYKLLAIGFILTFADALLSYFFTSREYSIYTSSMRPEVIIFSIGVLAVGLRRFSKSISILKIFDNNSLTIYYSHVIILAVVRKVFVLFSLDIDNTLFILIIFVLVAALSLIFSMILNKFFLQTKQQFRLFNK